MIPATDDFIRALKLPQKEVWIKLEFYDKDMNYIDEFTKQVTEQDINSISVDKTRPIRRSFSFALDNSKGEFTWGEDELIWLNKRVKLYIGLKLLHKQMKQIEYIPQGVYIVTSPSDSHNNEGKKCFIEGMDKAYLFTDKRGKFINQLTIEEGTNIAQAIKIIAQDNGEIMFNFDDISATVPYDLTFQSNDNRWNAMQELALFAECDIYYDFNGYLRLKKINLNDFTNYPPTWKYEYGGENATFYAGNIRRFDEANLANAIRVVGGSGQTATVVYDLIVDENDPLWVDSPYTTQQIGYILHQHNNGNPDGLITVVDEAKWRAKYELMNRLGYSERVSLNIAPNFLHEAGDIIEIVDNENNVNGRYMIESFSLPLIPDLMTIECRKERRIITDWNFI